MRSQDSQQHELFEEARKTADIPDAQRSILLRLLERLLIEAVTVRDEGKRSVDNSESAEIEHEQDHA
jgi:hypothetical protein